MFAPTGGSLIDGNYQLTVMSAEINGGQFDGNGYGFAGDNKSVSLHRLFGDVKGDAKVDAIDFGGFRAAFNSASPSPSYNSAFDFNNDG